MARSARRSPDAPAQSRSDQDSHTSSRTTSQSASTNTQTRTPPIPSSSGRAQRVNDTPASPRATNYSCRLGAGQSPRNGTPTPSKTQGYATCRCTRSDTPPQPRGWQRATHCSTSNNSSDTATSPPPATTTATSSDTTPQHAARTQPSKQSHARANDSPRSAKLPCAATLAPSLLARHFPRLAADPVLRRRLAPTKLLTSVVAYVSRHDHHTDDS